MGEDEADIGGSRRRRAGRACGGAEGGGGLPCWGESLEGVVGGSRRRGRGRGGAVDLLQRRGYGVREREREGGRGRLTVAGGVSGS